MATMGFAENDEDYIWQDRELRFDSHPKLLECRRSEQIIDSINSVEDTKGNNGERGSLIVTNLRIMWVCHANNKVNLSVGFNNVISLNIKKAKSKLRGTTQALVVLCKQISRFEFIFTSLVKNSPRLFTTVQAVMRAYETSKMYRDVRLRGSIIRDGQLLLLPGEQIFTKVEGVWNLSSDQGSLGTYLMTNVRVVWFANLAPNFNVSLPYLSIKAVRTRDSKFGKALVIETFKKAGGYSLGFRIDPLEKLDVVMKELVNFRKVYSLAPNFGVEFSVEGEAPSIQELLAPRIEEDVEIVEDVEDSHAVAAYYSVGGGAGGHEYDHVHYDDSTGLAIESMQAGVTMEQLWRIM